MTWFEVYFVLFAHDDLPPSRRWGLANMCLIVSEQASVVDWACVMLLRRR